MEIGVNPNVEVISERFLLNTAHDVWVEPGHYDFNERSSSGTPTRRRVFR